jgi:predicted aminopeptidase
VLLAGCANIGYYAQSVGGQLSLLSARQPIAEVIADPATDPQLAARLALALEIRDYASRVLKLPDNGSYRSYADLKRPYVVWNVWAAPEFSVTPRQWCFPVAGCVTYRGYFAEDAARAYAKELAAQGAETFVSGVPAYSTLGWFDDPVLNTFIRLSDYELARLIFHELAHQVAFAEGDTEFNESFATAVERIGGARWLAEHASAAVREEDERAQARRRDFKALTLSTREQLDAVFRSSASDAEKRAAKAEIMAAMRRDHDQLKAGPWSGFSGYDAWFARANNASLGMQAAYNELVPAFEALFEAQGRDFPRFYAEVRRLAALPKAERRATLGAPQAASLASHSFP